MCMHVHVCVNLDCKEYFIKSIPLPTHTPVAFLLFPFCGSGNFTDISWLPVICINWGEGKGSQGKGSSSPERHLAQTPISWAASFPFLAICVRARSAMSLQVQRWSCWEEQSPHLPCLVIKVLVLHHHPLMLSWDTSFTLLALEMARESHHLIFILFFQLESHKVTVKSPWKCQPQTALVCVWVCEVFF